MAWARKHTGSRSSTACARSIAACLLFWTSLPGPTCNRFFGHHLVILPGSPVAHLGDPGGRLVRAALEPGAQLIASKDRRGHAPAGLPGDQRDQAGKYLIRDFQQAGLESERALWLASAGCVQHLPRRPA